MFRRGWSLPLLITGLLASVVLALAPADAVTAMPRILLKGGAAEVSRTYTATAVDRAFPSGSTPRYQWYRGDKAASAGSFRAITGATGRSYTLKSADHLHTVQVVVKAVRNGHVVGVTHSAASNWIMLNMAPPVLSGTPLVGHTITATLGAWAKEWHTSLWWRNTGVPIPGERGLTYVTRPADAGKEISLLAIGEYTYPNGVHPIDRYASRMRIKWGTKSILRGTSPSAGKLTLTAIPYAAGAKQSIVHGRVGIYDNGRWVRKVWIESSRKTFTLTGLRRGTHNIKMVFVSNPWFAGSRVTRSFTVR